MVAKIAGLMPVSSTKFMIKAPGTGEDSGWEITFGGPGHPKAVAYGEQLQRQTLERNSQIEAQQRNGRKIKPESREPAEVRRESVGWVVSRIIDWTPVEVVEGEPPIEFSDEAAIRLLSQPEMGWAFGQMVDFLTDERSFTQSSAKG